VNWINNVVRPKIRSFLTTKREVPENLWIKCPESGQMVFYKDLEANQFVIPGSNYHMRMTAQQRLQHLFDNSEYTKVPVPEVPHDPLRFRDNRRYSERLKAARSETQLDDAVLVGEGTLDGYEVVAAAQDFRFMAGSLGMAAGEAVIAGMLRAVEKRTPFILFAASGGARMQEGILSLMQMPRTTIAVQKLREARLPYLVVLTDPTTGGVTASYAMLGDIHIAEPGALICFAGPRVIQQTIREQLPEGFQRAEYLLAHGMIDMVVHRHELRETLARLCRILSPRPATVRPAKLETAADFDRRYFNGSPVDGRTIETLARSSDLLESDAAGEEDGSEEVRERAKRDSAGTMPRPRDGARG
jgi:acetyl-CoA carboxylase carboxyl transferase subunit beta